MKRRHTPATAVPDVFRDPWYRRAGRRIGNGIRFIGDLLEPWL